MNINELFRRILYCKVIVKIIIEHSAASQESKNKPWTGKSLCMIPIQNAYGFPSILHINT